MNFFIVSVLAFFMVACDYSYYNSNKEQLKIQKKQASIIEDSISNYIINNLDGDYTPYSFNKLTVNKPKQIKELDTLYLERKVLVKNNSKSKLNYDSLLSNLNAKINLKKKEINESKVFHTYEMTHIYTLSKQSKITLYENKFTYLPNFKLKNVSTIFSTNLSLEEKVLFDYFSLQNPLYESGTPEIDLQVNNEIYSRFNYALANETKHKAKLLHTILFYVKYIRQYNDINTNKMAEELAKNWIHNNNLDESLFEPKFEELKEIKDKGEIVEYTMRVINKKEGNIKSINFNFDLNLVITNTIIQ